MGMCVGIEREEREILSERSICEWACGDIE
jgi:hypothetical protein